ncbi:MAG: hypothetical protein ACPGQD_03705 [Planctomycetota bacterium]
MAHLQQMDLLAEITQSFALDNGAFSLWSSGQRVNFDAFAQFVREWHLHPGFDWCLIPDVIDGSEQENEATVWRWLDAGFSRFSSVPVWHLHESLHYLDRLASAFPRIALGSSGEWATPGTERWWERIAEAMSVACDDRGRPRAKLHGLRMLDPTVFSSIPLASADSSSVARNVGLDSRWQRGYLAGISKEVRAEVLIDRIEAHASAATWSAPAFKQRNLDLLG